jgi:hypothetical protein
MSEPKKHHFLPQFYLEKFKIRPQRTKHPQIMITTKEPQPRTYCAAIHDTGCIGDYHTIDFHNEDKDRKKIEAALSKIESEQSNLLKRIISEKKIDADDKLMLASLLIFMHHRVPKYKKFIERSVKATIHSWGELMLRHGKLPPMPEALKKTGLKSFHEIIKIKISNWKIIFYMYDASIYSELINIIEKITFNLLISPEGGQFITGDTPVSIYHPNYDNVAPYGVGFIFKEIEVTFPLSPEIILLASWNTDDKDLNITEKQLNEYNRRTIIMADQYIYSNDTDDSLIMLVSKNASKEAGFKVDQLDFGEGMYLIKRFIPVTNQ